jgi:hypothetical protein
MDTRTILLVAVAIGLTVWGLVEWGAFSWVKWPTFGGKAKPNRKAILGLLDDAHAYFDEAGCKEGMAAIKTAVSHVYVEHPHA